MWLCMTRMFYVHTYIYVHKKLQIICCQAELWVYRLLWICEARILRRYFGLQLCLWQGRDLSVVVILNIIIASRLQANQTLFSIVNFLPSYNQKGVRNLKSLISLPAYYGGLFHGGDISSQDMSLLLVAMNNIAFVRWVFQRVLKLKPPSDYDRSWGVRKVPHFYC